MKTSNQASDGIIRGTRILIVLFCLVLAGVEHPVFSAVAPPQSPTRQVIASASGDSVRFVSLGELIQIRLEVVGSAGESLFDSGFKSSNVIDWAASDNNDKRLADGSYLCVLTVKDSTGKTTKKQTIAVLHDQSITLKQANSSVMSVAQADASQASGEDSDVTLVEPGAPTGSAVLAQDGNTAHLSSGTGGLSISSGDFFANKLLEHIRLTAEGNVGIGTGKPQAKLDVAGQIRASEGIVFPDGSIQMSAASKTLGAASLAPGQHGQKHAQGHGQEIQTPDISGTGTTGKISKWIDGPNGVLGDSNITEATGAIGINGAPNTAFRLDVNGSTRIRGANASFRLEGLRPAGNIWLFQTVDDDGRFRLFGQDNSNPGVERLTISLSTGNVGIGATTPGAKLDVAGIVNSSTYYSLEGIRVLYAPSLNTFVGKGAGLLNNSGDNNAFVGYQAGLVNTTGDGNSFFGSVAGSSNSTGNSNSFFGFEAGKTNRSGGTNAFFGFQSGRLNSSASGNSFYGALSGPVTTNGDHNSFFGYQSGNANTSGAANSFFGNAAGSNNTSGSFNTYIGYAAGDGSGIANQNGSNNVAIGYGAGQIIGSNQSGASNNTFIGAGSRGQNNNTAVQQFATAIGAGAIALGNTGVWLGRAGQDDVIVGRTLTVGQFTGGAGEELCRSIPSSYGPSDFIGVCNSSLRYKKDVETYLGGMDIVRRLRPITFNWIESGAHDLGFGAEEVEKVEPLLVFNNAKGQTEGVKYRQISAVLVNAVNEQQRIIEQQQRKLEALMQLVCASNPQAEVCKKSNE